MSIETENDKKSTISISIDVKERIKKHGNMGDSFDDALTKILNKYEEYLKDGEENE